MKKTKQFIIKSFVRGVLFVLFLALVYFAYDFIQNILGKIIQPVLNTVGLAWLSTIPGVSLLLTALAAIVIGSLLAIKSVRAKIKKIPLLSIPVKFSESVENLSGFPAVLVATVPGVYQIGFVTGTPRKNGEPNVGVFIPDLPSFVGGRILIFSLNNVELIIEPKSLGEMLSAMMGSTQYAANGLDENAKSEFKTKPLKGMSYEALTTILRNARKAEQDIPQ